MTQGLTTFCATCGCLHAGPSAWWANSGADGCLQSGWEIAEPLRGCWSKAHAPIFAQFTCCIEGSKKRAEQCTCLMWVWTIVSRIVYRQKHQEYQSGACASCACCHHFCGVWYWLGLWGHFSSCVYFVWPTFNITATVILHDAANIVSSHEHGLGMLQQLFIMFVEQGSLQSRL